MDGMDSNFVAFAQINNSKNADISGDISTEKNKTFATTNTLLTTTAYNTFSGVGTISSLNFDNNSVPNIANAKKVILSGHWTIYVNNGTISYFEADFTAAPSDGGISHTHQFVNLQPDKGKAVQLMSNGDASIRGTVDVKINGVTIWNDVKAAVLISRGNSITIILDDMATQHHFTGQPIYGIVDRLMF